MKFVILLLALLGLVAADKWAVLVAGSNGYWNYRHQADVAHAYHILIQNGYKPENVIVFSYNDVPNHAYNPFPGTLYNRPGDDSINYYEGLVIDYEGENATAENYLKVLVGDESAGGKVLKSTEEDIIFLSYFDHGSPGLVAFPSGGYLYRDKLEAAFATMKEKKMFSKIVYYLEACESGSMFVNLAEDGLIYGLTAANPTESSWGWYCGSETIVKGKSIGSCLGDEFSVRWMENVDEGNLTQTFEEHADYLVEAVTKSHVSRYGDFSFKTDPISEVFEGDLVHLKMNKKYKKIEGTRGDVYLNKLNYLKGRAARTNSRADQDAVQEELDHIQKVDTYFHQLVSKMKQFGKYKELGHVSNVQNMECYRKSIDIVEKTLGQSDYMLQYYHILASMCDQYNETPAYL